MLKEFRCKKCHKLLAKISDYSELEIKCNRCKQINYYVFSSNLEYQNAKQRSNIFTDALHRNI
ncbi:Com family DNA-binding transcriptional regulator [Gammaproteobacteria bacterium ESL0073]|uniref:Com family DNA-binding transcriptional regulator n=1 Tax=Entomomonas moraniae TaxID=2213226 RepID=A0A3S9XAX5_9GAMM|nr:Com family DNA-binding transcriptional regulator [Entomomonas moraniae]AWM80748.1 Com family DNA-binding transcriptional regulator [Gammaproteobacteria bacterium ESL0073]AZS49603.1 Com family DNA-binding transcriptional regulator [Entomomonas moraniae]